MPSILCSAIVSMFALQTVALFPPIEVRGHVYKQDGSPAAHAMVEAYDPTRATGSMSTGFTYVDRTGNFVLRLPAYGRYEIIARQTTNGLSVGAPAEAHTMLDFRYGEIHPEISLRLPGR
jgi:hypothetical protein